MALKVPVINKGVKDLPSFPNWWKYSSELLPRKRATLPLVHEADLLPEFCVKDPKAVKTSAEMTILLESQIKVSTIGNWGGGWKIQRQHGAERTSVADLPSCLPWQVNPFSNFPSTAMSNLSISPSESQIPREATRSAKISLETLPASGGWA